MWLKNLFIVWLTIIILGIPNRADMHHSCRETDLLTWFNGTDFLITGLTEHCVVFAVDAKNIPNYGKLDHARLTKIVARANDGRAWGSCNNTRLFFHAPNNSNEQFVVLLVHLYDRDEVTATVQKCRWHHESDLGAFICILSDQPKKMFKWPIRENDQRTTNYSFSPSAAVHRNGNFYIFADRRFWSYKIDSDLTLKQMTFGQQFIPNATKAEYRDTTDGRVEKIDIPNRRFYYDVDSGNVSSVFCMAYRSGINLKEERSFQFLSEPSKPIWYDADTTNNANGQFFVDDDTPVSLSFSFDDFIYSKRMEHVAVKKNEKFLPGDLRWNVMPRLVNRQSDKLNYPWPHPRYLIDVGSACFFELTNGGYVDLNLHMKASDKNNFGFKLAAQLKKYDYTPESTIRTETARTTMAPFRTTTDDDDYSDNRGTGYPIDYEDDVKPSTSSSRSLRMDLIRIFVLFLFLR